MNENAETLGIPFRRIDKLQLHVKELPSSEYSKLLSEIKAVFGKNKNEREENLNGVKVLQQLVTELQHFFSFRKKNLINAQIENSFTIIVSENLFFLLVHDIVHESFELSEQLNYFGNFLGGLIESVRNTMESGLLDGSAFRDVAQSLLLVINQNHETIAAIVPVNTIARIQQLIKDLQEFNVFLLQMLQVGTYHHNAIYFNTSDKIMDELLNRYYSATINLRFMRFDWPKLSAGEESLIAFFSRLHQVANLDKNQNLILLIDEGDLYFHPEWQRRYIFYLLNYLSSLYIDFKWIQVILTTHSPFIVADLPQDNIIFMDRHEDVVIQVKPESKLIETFGGNLHALYSKAFFLGSSTTSEFALQKIRREIIEPLENRSNDIDLPLIKRLISLIGEPVIKMALDERLKRRESNDQNS